ncbi:MAG: dTMP kinase [Rhodoferax sp.]|nr:MAG: dTMP kinase [Rhodoferax sp.]
MKNGLFISIEGIDGAGKSTHIERLAQLFRQQGRTVVVSREPGGTALAEKLRTLLLNEHMDSLSEALVMFAARREHVVDVIAPALARGEVVISDRFTDSSFAYQGGGRQFDAVILQTLESWVQAVPAVCMSQLSLSAIAPHLTLWFDLPAQVAASRLASSRAPDKFEAQSLAFFERVVQGYRQRLHSFPERIARINADQPIEQVWAEVHQCVVSRLVDSNV